ncbi:MAG: hypothetical protein AAF547_19210 [Actinomycetota bacterium]
MIGILAQTGTDGGLPELTAIGLYLLYALVAVGLVVFLARTLYANGRVFLASAFEEEELAASVNKLLVIGFYLLNLGYALLVYQLQPSYPNLTEAFNELVLKLGILLVSLGVIHLINMLIFWKIRNGRRVTAAGPQQLPPPSAMVPPPPGPLLPPPPERATPASFPPPVGAAAPVGPTGT